MPFGAIASSTGAFWTGVELTNYDNDFMTNSYSMNIGTSHYPTGVGDGLLLNHWWWASRQGFSRPELVEPSEASFIADAPRWQWGWLSPYFTWNIDTEAIEGWDQAFRHNGRVNVVYMDGHVVTRRHAYDTGENIWVDIYSD